MKHTRIAALLAAAALAIFLTACGGGGDDGGDTSSAPAESTAPAEETGGNETASAGGGLTPSGTTLKVGEGATVGWVPLAEAALEANDGSEMMVWVDAIEEGSIDDFEGIDLPADDKDNVPFYVKYRIEALEDATNTSGSNDPDIEFTPVSADGEDQVPVSIIGAFEPCTNETVPTPFKAGESYESCYVYLVPADVEIASVKWDNGPNEEGELSEYYEDPIVWEAG